MAINLWKKFEETASRSLDSIAIKDKKAGRWENITYGGLKRNIESLTSFLQKEGIGKGDKVGIVLENGAEWPVIFFSTVLVGGVSIPLNPASTHEEIENILKDSGCKLVFAGKDFFDPVREICRSCPGVENVILVDPVSFKNTVTGQREEVDVGQVGRDDLACILYTSGTTAEPKGVMLTHGNLLSNCDSLFRMNIITQDDSVVSILPLHHTYPLTVTMLLPLLYGGKVIYPGTMRGEAVLEAMRETRTTVFVAVPQILHSFGQKIAEQIKKIIFPFNLLFRAVIEVLYKIRNRTGINLSRWVLGSIHRRFGKSLRMFVSGGARLDENAARDLVRLGFTIIEGYGLTESSPVLTLNPAKKAKIGSVGLPILDVELKIGGKNEEGVGEVIASGPNIMEGYYKRKDLTAEALKDGWLHTGDLGYIDEDGYLFLTGRVKDVIVLSSGVNVYPEEIEHAYLSASPVEEMCVFEVPSKKEEDQTLTLWAVVVPDLEFFKKYGEINLKGVIRERFDNVSRSLPSHMRLRGFSVTLDKLPRTLLGKVKRFEVREKFTSTAKEEMLKPEERELSGGDLELMETDRGRKIIKYLAKQTGIKRSITPPDLLELDLGIDSLGRIELAAGLEKVLGIEIEDEVIGRAFTVRDLIKGAEPLLARAGKAVPAEKISYTPGEWKETLQGLPGKGNLEKIDLHPGWWAWLAGFLFTCMNKVFFKLFYRLRVEGIENFPKARPYILYVNHASYYDGLIVASSLPRFPRLELFFVGFRPYFNVPIIRNLIKVGRIIPLDFSSHLLEALKSCYYVLKNKGALCLFPEGIRTLTGEIGEFKKGFGILAKETGAKLVPVLIEGAYEAWPRTSKYPKIHPLKVRFGKALDPEELEKEGLKMGAKDGYTAICMSARKILIDMKDRT
ncbi:MAG: AMP-binding protein [Candidatus Omnitrophota bacterium]